MFPKLKLIMTDGHGRRKREVVFDDPREEFADWLAWRYPDMVAITPPAIPVVTVSSAAAANKWSFSYGAAGGFFVAAFLFLSCFYLRTYTTTELIVAEDVNTLTVRKHRVLTGQVVSKESRTVNTSGNTLR